VHQLAGAPNLIPPRKTAGWRCAPPEKKPPQRAAISVLFPKWCNFTLLREPSFSGAVSKPRRLSAVGGRAPPAAPFAFF